MKQGEINVPFFSLFFSEVEKSFILSVKPMGQAWTWNQEELSRTSPSSPPPSSGFSLSFFCSSSCARVCSGFFPSWTSQEVTNRTAGMVFGNPVGSRHWATSSVNSRLFRLTGCTWWWLRSAWPQRQFGACRTSAPKVRLQFTLEASTLPASVPRAQSWGPSS